jgi:allantoate deiminase
VIAGRARATLDVRHASDAARERALATLREEVARACERRGVSVSWEAVAEHPAVPCTPALVELLAGALEQCGVPAHRLASGAGHDAVALAAVAPVAMLFVRCRGGISHHPDESVEAADVALAIDAAARFAQALAER